MEKTKLNYTVLSKILSYRNHTLQQVYQINMTKYNKMSFKS